MCSGKNIYLDNFDVIMDQQNSVDTIKFCSILNNFDLKSHIIKATHSLGIPLIYVDFIENSIVGSVNVEPHNTISDHVVVNFNNFVDPIAKKIKE